MKVEQPCEIQLDALPDTRLAGVISRIVPTVDRSKATVLVKVRFVDRDPRVLPDMSAKVAFLSKPVPAEERQPVIAVQPGAIVERDGKKIAFVVKDDRIRTVPVNPGRKVGELVAVGGLRTGDKVVLNPGEKLAEGAAVSVARK